jgi:hypothetical protein
VTPTCHTAAPPRVPGDSLRGKRPHDYGRGRVCSLPGCTTILRRTHKGPVCDPCINDNAKARARASACAAPAPRAMKEEKVRSQTESLRETVLAVFTRDPSRSFNAGDVVGYSGVSPSCVYKNLKSLVASGEIVKDGPGVYRWPKIEDAKTAPDLIPPAPAPVIPPPEQPAEVAAADSPMVEPPPAAGIVPFAGIATTTLVGYSMSGELRILADLEDLDDEAYERVMQYTLSKRLLK